MEGGTKKKLLDFKTRLDIARVLEEWGGDEKVIECDTIAALIPKIAHAIGKDSSDITRSPVEYIAKEMGISLRPSNALSLPNVLRRVIALEELCATLSARCDELERVYIEGGKAAYADKAKTGG